MSYDSKSDTLAHIARVREFLHTFSLELEARAELHDKSKLQEPEKSLFDEWTPKLAELDYGSDEYRDALKQLGPALQHHYANNRHHPEHFENGIADMNLFDLLEMLADWKAAGERHRTGNMKQSLVVNAKRFNIPDGLFSVLVNTAQSLGWIEQN